MLAATGSGFGIATGIANGIIAAGSDEAAGCAEAAACGAESTSFVELFPRVFVPPAMP
jgi:hypothetical protein